MGQTFVIISSYFKTAFRTIIKNKTFSLINIFGLAISLAVGLVMLTFINELNQYDKFFDNADRVYRINNKYQYLQEDPSFFASTSVSAGKQVQTGVAGIEATTIIRDFNSDFGYNEKWIPLEGFWASEDFFKVLSFELLEGNITTALKEPNTMVITEKAAKKLFDDENPMGKTLDRPGDESSFLITGVVRDIPNNSHLDFEVIGSFVTHEAENEGESWFMKWRNMWSYHVYMLLEQGKNPNDVQIAFNEISANENSKDEHRKINIELQALHNITPGRDLSNELGKTMESEILWMIAGLTLIVIISACFNYTNLSIARSLRRAKEIGVRKVNGASRTHIMLQFLVEAVIISVMALIIAIALFYFIKPHFLALDSSISEMVTMSITGSLLLQFFILAISTGLVAGFLPALMFSRMNAQSVLKDGAESKSIKGLTLRKILIVLQFTLSLMFIVGASMEYNQYRFSLNFDLGYNTENVLNINLQDNDANQIKTELVKIPEITAISKSLMVTSVGNYWANTMKYKDPMDSVSVYFNGIDEHYLPLHDHKILFGNNFNADLRDTAVTQVIVNQKLLDYFDVPRGEESIGEELTMNDEKAIIVGVVDDFHYGTVESEIKPFLFQFYDEDFYKLNLKISTHDLLSTMGKIESAWAKIDEVHPLEATFYEERIEDTYNEAVVMVKIIGILAFLAITIAVMGLLGMVMFTTEIRLKEISIRKVLGASEGSLIALMGKGFMILLLIAAALAIPATYWIYDQMVFEKIDYRAPIGFIELFGGAVIVFFLALLAIVSQTMTAARSNPANVLRNE